MKTIQQSIQTLPKEIQIKIYILCFRSFWRDYVPLTAKIPTWYNRKNEIEKIKFEATIKNIHFLHLPFNTLLENKEWIMGCQCNYCIKTTKRNRKRKYYEFRKQYLDPEYFKLIMPNTETYYNDEYIYDGHGARFHYDPLCGSCFEEPDRYELRTNDTLLEFSEID